MGLVRNNPETFENAVASLVDMTSILFAYQIGVYGFGIGFGVLYACFDAFIVIWMRKPISRFARAVNPFRLVKKESFGWRRRSGEPTAWVAEPVPLQQAQAESEAS